MTGTTARPTGRIAGIGGGLVGFLVFVEFTSGVLQGYYIPLLTDVARHLDIHDADVNWLEAAQLMLSAIAVPILAKLGDLYGHRRMLLLSAAVTAAATVVLAFAQSFPVFLIAWAVQGVYAAWLPLQVALIYNRSRGLADPAAQTRRATGLIVAALQFGAIVGRARRRAGRQRPRRAVLAGAPGPRASSSSASARSWRCACRRARTARPAPSTPPARRC